MLNMAKTLSLAASVTERLLFHFGAEQIWQVEQLSDHIFRAWLNDGRVALAIAQDNGTLNIKEIEELW